MIGTRYLLDTNVVSESSRNAPNARVMGMIDRFDPALTFISAVTLAEINHGIELQEDGSKQARLKVWLEFAVLRPFSGRVIQADHESWLIWLRLKFALDKKRQRIEAPDLMIAAIGLLHSMTIVTRDVEPFKQAGVPFLNPWD